MSRIDRLGSGARKGISHRASESTENKQQPDGTQPAMLGTKRISHRATESTENSSSLAEHTGNAGDEEGGGSKGISHTDRVGTGAATESTENKQQPDGTQQAMLGTKSVGHSEEL